MVTVQELKALIVEAMDSRGETSDGIARGAGVSPETVRGIRLDRTSKMKAHSRDKLYRYLTRGLSVGPAPQHPPQAESATPRHISGAGSVLFTGSASATTGPTFDSEDHRRGYLQKTLQDAARAIAEAQVALHAPLTAPVADAAMARAGQVAAQSVQAVTDSLQQSDVAPARTSSGRTSQ